MVLYDIFYVLNGISLKILIFTSLMMLPINRMPVFQQFKIVIYSMIMFCVSIFIHGL